MSQKPVVTSDRRACFKNAGKTSDEMRRKRSDITVELRKAARNDQMFKRRNIDSLEDSDEENVPTESGINIMSPIKLTIDEMIQGMQSSNSHERMIATRYLLGFHNFEVLDLAILAKLQLG